jgi:NTP pyrophosphatase (non-canonical NTP hydrolase)
MDNLTDFSKMIHRANVEKGFYDRPVETGTALMLVTSELAEALEADRHNLRANRIEFLEEIKEGVKFQDAFKHNIKDTYEDEIADAIIRLLDHCGYKGIDIEFHVQQKLKYNKSREIRHGKSY